MQTDSTKPVRIAILHQGCIPIYRRAFYEQLAKIAGREYVVIHGDPEPDTGIVAAEPPFSFPNIHVQNTFFKIFGRSLALQSVFVPVLKGHFSALVLGHEIKYVSNTLLLLLFWMMRRPVVLWGHGHTNDYFIKQRSFVGRRLGDLVEWFKRRLILTASGYMAYTERGADYVASVGLPRDKIAVLWNTIDLKSAITAYKNAQQVDRAELRREHGLSPDAIVFMFIGRLYPPKRVDVLVETVKRLRPDVAVPIEVMIVGSGPDEEKLRHDYGALEWCKFLGKIVDEETLGRVFRCADAVVLPGKVGLVVNHAFAHGQAVIACRMEVQPPEVEYIKHGHNGLVLEGDEAFAEGLRQFSTNPELRNKLTQGAVGTRRHLELEHMVEAFDGAVAKALEGEGAKPSGAA